MATSATCVLSRRPARPGSRGPGLCLLACLLAALASSQAHAQSPPADTCVTCHLQAGDERLTKPTRDFARDVHQAKGLTCAACHGGDPSDASMDAMGKAKGFVGVPTHQQIPAVCGKCHSDPQFMKRYDPQLRVDQVAEYKTSVHGRRLDTLKDQKVAVCTSCHTAHTILPASDAQSTVYPLQVARTCARCHADAGYMAGYGIPTDQYRKYTASVHWTTLNKVGDLSAPTCNDCHGNHGAVPPGVTSVANVCGQCHSVQAGRYEGSAHFAVFRAMNMPGCITCHENHEVRAASDQMLGALAPAVCATCHDPSDAGGKTAATMRALLDQLRTAGERAVEILQRAERAGMEVGQAQFDLNGANDDLVTARAAVHSLDAAAVRGPVEEGLKIARSAYQHGVDALSELRFRRNGLTVSLVIILLVIAGIALKIREIERRPGRGPKWRPIGRT